MELIDRQEAIEILKNIQKKRGECGCRGSSYEYKALGYAIEVLKQLPVKEVNDEEEP